MTDRDRWLRLRELFAAAQMLDSERRESFLDANCGDDMELRREVESLLAQDADQPEDKVAEVLMAAVRDVAEREESAGDASLTGTRLGNIRLLRLHGSGGMGEVYVGFDEALQRRVALKAIRRSRISPESRARFLREARTLSRLEHPNICGIHDYLQGEDRDFLVLEWIEGASLAEAAPKLSRSERMDVAVQIAQVLVAAHGQSVIHRDLKPANIMLTAEGHVKVLDFGLARVASGPENGGEAPAARLPQGLPEDDSTLPWGGTDPASAAHGGATLTDHAETSLGQIFGTPLFMSPEQAAGAVVGTASDMYSFGLLLQQLFTGRSPQPSGLSPAVLLTRAREARSLPVAGLDSDLQDLIQRLKSPAPAARPTAVEALARLRWIQAKPKRRLRLWVAAVTLLVLALGVFKYTVDLAAARDEANRRREQAENLLGFLVGDLRRNLESIGRLDLLDDLGDRALQYFATARPEELSDDELSHQAQALTQIGEVRLNQRRYDEALASFSEANRRSSALAARHSQDAGRLFDRGQTEFWVGYVHWRRGNFDESRSWLTRYLRTSEALLAFDPNREEWIREVAFGHHNLAVLALEFARYDEAKRGFLDEVAVLERLLENDPGNDKYTEDLADALSWLGTTARRRGELHRASEYFQRSATQRSRLVASHPDNSQWRYWWSQAIVFEAQIKAVTGRRQEAAALFDQALTELNALVAGDPTNREWIRIRSGARIDRADLMAGGGLLEDGREEARLAALDLEALVAAEPSDRQARLDLVRALQLAARVDLQARRNEAAGQAIARSLAIVEDLQREGRPDFPALAEMASTLVLQGRQLQASGAPERAGRSWRRAIDLLEGPVKESRFPDLLDPFARALALSGERARSAEVLATLADLGYRPVWPWPSGGDASPPSSRTGSAPGRTDGPKELAFPTGQTQTIDLGGTQP